MQKIGNKDVYLRFYASNSPQVVCDKKNRALDFNRNYIMINYLKRFTQIHDRCFFLKWLKFAHEII